MKFHRAIVFCSNPIKGSLRVKDIFQIYPLMEKNAPNNKHVKMYPFVLEFCVEEEENIEREGELKELSKMIGGLTQESNARNHILSLLTAFSNYYFFLPNLSLQWFISADPSLSEKEINAQSSKPGLNMYYYPESRQNAPLESFTKIDFPEIESKEHIEYFKHIDIDGKNDVAFSQHIIGAFHNYYLLSPIQRAAVDASAQLINHGIALRETMKSLSFLSFISSIETMVALENRDIRPERCESCGQDKYRVMAKFKDYLLKYASTNPDIKKEFARIYTLRSKIVHSGMLLLGDGKIDWSNNKEKDTQWWTHLLVMQTSRISLINWILMRAEAEKT